MTAMGIRDMDVAVVIGITPPTLRKHFAKELKRGHIQATAKVAQSLYTQALGRAADPERGIEYLKPNVAAAIFWMKCRAGWREDGDYIGKKEQCQEAAEKVAKGKYAPSAAPRLVVNNTK